MKRRIFLLGSLLVPSLPWKSHAKPFYVKSISEQLYEKSVRIITDHGQKVDDSSHLIRVIFYWQLVGESAINNVSLGVNDASFTDDVDELFRWSYHVMTGYAKSRKVSLVGLTVMLWQRGIVRYSKGTK